MRRRRWWVRAIECIVPVSRSNVSTALENYLEYYKTIPRPGFAVLVTGKWGAGKTFQVKKALGCRWKKKKYYYVSLFGLVSSDDIVSSVYNEMYPSRGMFRRIWENLSGSQILGFSFGGLHSLARITMQARVRTDRAIIFDDLERTTLEHRVILGIINHYVENKGCHVIVICNDGKLEKSYRSWNEKVFGQNIRVFSRPHEIFEIFSKSLNDQRALAPHRNQILDLFDDSGVGSLRILKQTMGDTLRLIRMVSPEHALKRDSISELVSLFVAMSFEARAGRLKPKDVTNRASRGMSFRMALASTKRQEQAAAPKKPRMVRATERYDRVHLESEILSDKLIKQMVFNGVFDPEQLNGHLGQTAQFAEPEELPAWRKVAGFQKLDDRVVAEGISELKDQFERRLVSQPEELLHLFALRFMLAAKGAIPGSFAEVEDACGRYVDDLVAEGKLPAASDDITERLDPMSGALGFAYWVQPEYLAHFKHVVQKVRVSMAGVQEREHREAAPFILKLMKADGPGFYQEFVHTANGNPKFANFAVLQHIEPQAFVEAWASSPPSNWYWIKAAIDHRHEHPRPYLADERQWVIQVRELMGRRSQVRADEDGVTALRASQFEQSIPKMPAEPRS